MRQHRVYQSLKSKGVTLVELMIALAVMGLVVGVVSTLLLTAVKSFNFTLRETSSLTNSRQAFDANRSRRGLLWQARDARAIGALSGSGLTVNLTDGSTVQYTLTNNGLMKTSGAAVVTQALNINSMEVKYYGVNSQGLVVESTSPALALMVTAWIQIPQAKKNATFFSGASLRNKGP